MPKRTLRKKAANGKASTGPAGRLFEVRRSSIHGRGGFALRTIPKGIRIIEYTGEKITWKEVWRRYPDDDAEGEQNHTFLFEIDDRHVIDANRGGNTSRWINHSCSPNCVVVGEEDRIFIEAGRTIRPGEELRYDYNIQLPQRHTPAVKQQYRCLCGARSCRGTILGKKS
jgi:SET domain-containing protein